MASNDPITQWIADLKRDDQQAAEKLWHLYASRVAGLAKKTLGNLPKAAGDEEDVAQSAFRSFFLRARDEKFARLNDREDLWKLLGTITFRKSLKRLRRESRRPTTIGEVEQLLCQRPDEEWIVDLRDEISVLLHRLDEVCRQVAGLLLEGHTNQEIAQLLGFSLAKVERKRRLIRETWGQEVSA